MWYAIFAGLYGDLKDSLGIRPETTAPTMMPVNPTAATGVSSHRMRSAQGRIRPRAPSVSVTPIKRRKREWHLFDHHLDGHYKFHATGKQKDSAI